MSRISIDLSSSSSRRNRLLERKKSTTPRSPLKIQLSLGSFELEEEYDGFRLINIEDWKAFEVVDREFHFVFSDQEKTSIVAYETLLLCTQLGGQEITEEEMKLLYDQIRIQLNVSTLTHLRLITRLSRAPPLSLGVPEEHVAAAQFFNPMGVDHEKEYGFEILPESMYFQLLLLSQYVHTHFETDQQYLDWGDRRLSVLLLGLLLLAKQKTKGNEDQEEIVWNIQGQLMDFQDLKEFLQGVRHDILDIFNVVCQGEPGGVESFAENLQILDCVFCEINGIVVDGQQEDDTVQEPPNVKELQGKWNVKLPFPLNVMLYQHQMQCIWDHIDEDDDEFSQWEEQVEENNGEDAIFIEEFDGNQQDSGKMLKEQLDKVLHPNHRKFVRCLDLPRGCLGVTSMMHKFCLLNSLFENWVERQWEFDLWEALRTLVFDLKENQSSWVAMEQYEQELALAQHTVHRLLDYLTERLENYHYYYSMFPTPSKHIAMHLALAFGLRGLDVNQQTRFRSFSVGNSSGRGIDSSLVIGLIEKSMEKNFDRLIKNVMDDGARVSLDDMDKLINLIRETVSTEIQFFSASFLQYHPHPASISIRKLVSRYTDLVLEACDDTGESAAEITDLFSRMERLGETLIGLDLVDKGDLPEISKLYTPVARRFMESKIEIMEGLVQVATQGEDWSSGLKENGKNGPTDRCVDLMRILSQTLPVLSKRVFYFSTDLLDEFSAKIKGFVEFYCQAAAGFCLELPDIVPKIPKPRKKGIFEKSRTDQSALEIYSLPGSLFKEFSKLKTADLVQRLTNLQYVRENFALFNDVAGTDVVQECQEMIGQFEYLLMNTIGNWVVFFRLRKEIFQELYFPGVDDGPGIDVVMDSLGLLYDMFAMSATEEGMERFATCVFSNLALAFKRVLTDPAPRIMDADDIGTLERDWFEIQNFFSLDPKHRDQSLVGDNDGKTDQLCVEIDNLLLAFRLPSEKLVAMAQQFDEDYVAVKSDRFDPFSRENVLAVLMHRSDSLARKCVVKFF